MYGEEARWRRYAARMLRVIACGQTLDPNRNGTFADEVEEVYRSPWTRQEKQQPQTVEEIKERLLQRLKG